MTSTGWQRVFLACFMLWSGGPGLAEEKKEKKASSNPSKRGAKLGPKEAAGEAIAHALDWLLRHQDADGGWKAAGFTKSCKKPCENVDSALYGKGVGMAEHDVGVSALAVLAFARHGRSSPGGLAAEHRECLKRGCSWLLGTQEKSGDDAMRGRFGPVTNEDWIYNHALATLALAEAAGLAGMEIPKPAVEEAAKFCLRARNPDAAWRYGVQPKENDTSVTSWMVQALDTAKGAKLSLPRSDIAKSMSGALAWYDRATSPAGKVGYMAAGDEGARLNLRRKGPYPWSKQMSSMTAAAVLGRLLAGDKRTSKKLRAGIDLLVAELPRWNEEVPSTVSFYYWYYGTQALSLHGGASWKAWSPAVREALIPHQRKNEGDEAGSWDPIDEWGTAGGRVYSTAINALTLIPIAKGK